MIDESLVRFTAHQLPREELHPLMARSDGPALRRAAAGLMPGDHPLHGLMRRAADHSGPAESTRLAVGRNDVHPFPRRLQWKLPGGAVTG